MHNGTFQNHNINAFNIVTNKKRPDKGILRRLKYHMKCTGNDKKTI